VSFMSFFDSIRRFWVLQRVLAIIAVVLWAYLLWSGYDLCYGKGAAPPNHGQLQLYLQGPAVGLGVAILFAAVAKKVPLTLAWAIFAAEVFAFIWVCSMWGGGM
jgi:predicted metal-binding membrane protein